VENVTKSVSLQSTDFSAMAGKAEEAAEMLSALANSTRLLLLCALVAGETSVNELVRRSGISQSSVSQHLGKMRALKLVAARRDGKTVYYRLAGDEVKRILKVLHSIYCA
jgi:ArsR family transcriptional regulator, virulence genes transcriptional regulator